LTERFFLFKLCFGESRFEQPNIINSPVFAWREKTLKMMTGTENGTGGGAFAAFNKVDPHIVNNICMALGVDPGDISDVQFITAGDTNHNWSFVAKGEKYVYRHPSTSDTNNIDRQAEYDANSIAQKHGIDKLLVFLHPTEYWKITRFIETSRLFDYLDFDLVAQAFAVVRRLHVRPETIEHEFDIYQDFKDKQLRLTPEILTEYPEYKKMEDRIERLFLIARPLYPGKVICHNDCMYANLLVEKLDDGNERVHLIDWEYAGMCEPMDDLAAFAVSSPYNLEETKRAVEIWYGHAPSLCEEFYAHTYIAFNALYWIGWAILRKADGTPIGGNFLNDFFRFAQICGDYAEQLFTRALAEGLPFAVESAKQN
jgi:thiamine kinase-like enzyme